MNQFGLKPEAIAQINQIFATYPEISKAILYGSRARGNYKNGSDIDLTLISDRLTQHQLLEIETQIDDLLLPYFIDLSIFSSIDNLPLIEHIDKVGITFMRELTEALKMFNRREFYVCHDRLEAMWMEASYPEKTFYQGLLQIAVGLYHLGNQNWNGGKILLGEGISRLRDFQPEYMNVNTTKLIKESADLLKILQISGKEELKSLSPQLPEIEFGID